MGNRLSPLQPLWPLAEKYLTSVTISASGSNPCFMRDFRTPTHSWLHSTWEKWRVSNLQSVLTGSERGQWKPSQWDIRLKQNVRLENHLVKNRWRISLRNILPYSLYFFKRYNAWGSQTNAFWRHNFSFKRMAGQMKPNHWWKSSGLFRTESLFACLLTPSESWGPHTHGIRSTSNSNNALKHWNLWTLLLILVSTINPPRNTLQRAVVWGCIVLLFCPFLGRVAPRPPWHKSRKTQANQKSLNN